MNNDELQQQIGALINATSIQAVIGQLGTWLNNYADVVAQVDAQVDGRASDLKCQAYRELAERLANLAALRDGQRPGTMNAQDIYVSKTGSTLFVSIPRAFAANIDGGCQCEYCKAHPDVPPQWDTLAIAAVPIKGRECTWTVHMPCKRGVKFYGTHVSPDVTLSSGRTIRHKRMPNGSQDAIPTTGDYAMTAEESREYLTIRQRKQGGKS